MPYELKRYELVDPANNHDKFWQYQRNDNNVFITFGRRGTKGATQIKQFSYDSEATQFVAKMVREKLDKGYREVRGSGTVEIPPLPSEIPSARRSVSSRRSPPESPPPPEEPERPVKKDKADDASILAHGRARRTLG